MLRQIAYTLINLALITTAQLIAPACWWIFLPVSLLLGLLLSKKPYRVRVFAIGFIAGFLSWAGGTLYYHLSYEGVLLERTAALFFLPYWLFVPVVGIIAGLLNGLALYTGYSVFKAEKKLEL